MFKLKLVVGDWSCDGHGMTDTLYFTCSHDADSVIKAHTEGLKILGYEDNLCKSNAGICQSYEDDLMPKEMIDKLKAAGLNPLEYLSDDVLCDLAEGAIDFISEDSYRMDTYSFAVLYMDIAKLGLPNIVYEYARDTEEVLNIRGYGLLWS